MPINADRPTTPHRTTQKDTHGECRDTTRRQNGPARKQKDTQTHRQRHRHTTRHTHADKMSASWPGADGGDTYLKAIAESVCAFVTGFLNACTHTWPQSTRGPHAERAAGAFRASGKEVQDIEEREIKEMHNRFNTDKRPRRSTTRARKRKKCSVTVQHSPDQWQ
jgi:hypothetical protein